MTGEEQKRKPSYREELGLTQKKRDKCRRKGTNTQDKVDIFLQTYSRCRYLKQSYIPTHGDSVELHNGGRKILPFQIIHNGLEL